MKKLLMLIVAAAMTLAAYPAFATITTTPHDYQGNSGYGMCGTCHVPHAAVAGMGRLWRTGVAGGGTAWQTTKVGKLCNTCHNGSPSITGANRYTCNPVTMASLAYDPTSHRRSMTVLNTDLAGSLGPVGALPYTDAGANIECTSCHNPHDDGLNGDPGIRPFLRGVASISAFCAQCHGDRYNNGTFAQNNASGNHPVNVAYADSALNGSGVIRLRDNGGGRPAAAAAMTVGVAATNAATDTWPLGGKFQGDAAGAPIVGASPQGGTAANYIGCQTCHSVHKQAGDSNFLLAIDNTGTLTCTNTVTNDTLMGYSALCEGCHGGPSNTIGNVGAAAKKDHPVDQPMTGSPSIARWAMASGTEPRKQERTAVVNDIWPKAAAAAGNIMCTSCHSAHKATVYAAGNNTHLGKLTRHGNDAGLSDLDFCVSCHASMSPIGHHSNSSNTGGAFSPTASPVTCTGATGCHGGVAGTAGAHDFDFYGLSGDNTVLCKSCHILAVGGTDPVTDIISTYPSAVYTTLPGMNTPTAGHLGNVANAGAQSHTLVAFTDGANGIYAKTAAWGVSPVNVRTAGSNPVDVSKYGAGTALICESCHSVLGNIGASDGVGTYPAGSDTTGWKNNLLLADYKDDSDTQANSRLVGSGFCVACHNSGGVANATYNLGATAGIPADAAINDTAATPSGQYGMHPMTNWTISKAKDVDRETNGASATNKLITGPDATSVALYGSYADAGTAPPDSGGGIGTDSTVSYPGTNAMDCDSCHRPHLAPDTATFDQVMGGTLTRPVIVEVNAAANEFSDLCQKCHAY